MDIVVSMNNQELLSSIQIHFPKWNKARAFYQKQMDRDEYIQLRKMLSSLIPTYTPSALGLVLYDIAFRRDIERHVTAVLVVDYLTVDISMLSIESFRKVDPIKCSQLEELNIPQTEIIIDWLKLAKTWPVYKHAEWRMDDPLDYWIKRLKARKSQFSSSDNSIDSLE
ncbi:MAG: hypothetical protein ACAI35_00175 [Candidatus Methylacidiphilales bacterium]|nr:hypothetical protein [Candidatus Methylacidiphilales bacterium]